MTNNWTISSFYSPPQFSSGPPAIPTFHSGCLYLFKGYIRMGDVGSSVTLRGHRASVGIEGCRRKHWFSIVLTRCAARDDMGREMKNLNLSSKEVAIVSIGFLDRCNRGEK